MERPFYVVLDGMEVKVYGTSFNVNTHYQGKILTTLVEGKVGIRVKSTGGRKASCNRTKMAEFNCEKEEVEVTDVDTYYYTAWRAGSSCSRTRRLRRSWIVCVAGMTRRFSTQMTT